MSGAFTWQLPGCSCVEIVCCPAPPPPQPALCAASSARAWPTPSCCSSASAYSLGARGGLVVPCAVEPLPSCSFMSPVMLSWIKAELSKISLHQQCCPVPCPCRRYGGASEHDVAVPPLVRTSLVWGMFMVRSLCGSLVHLLLTVCSPCSTLPGLCGACSWCALHVHLHPVQHGVVCVCICVLPGRGRV